MENINHGVLFPLRNLLYGINGGWNKIKIIMFKYKISSWTSFKKENVERTNKQNFELTFFWGGGPKTAALQHKNKIERTKRQ